MKILPQMYSRLLVLTLMLSFVSLSNLAASESADKKTKKEDSKEVKQAKEEYNAGVAFMAKARATIERGDSAFAYNYRATSNAKAKRDYEKAVEKFATAVELYPDFKEAFSNLGFCFRKLGKLDKSIYAYNKALSIDSDFEQAIEYLGETFLALNELGKANFNLMRLREMKSDYADSLSVAIKAYKLAEFGKKLDSTKSK